MSAAVPPLASPLASHVMSARELALRQAEHGFFPVVEPFARVLPRGGLQRSSVYRVTGPASFSAVWALVATATQHGSWLCLVDMPHAGLLAAREHGVALERVVQVNTGATVSSNSSTWSRVVGALVDGIDLVVAHRPSCHASDARKVCARVKARSAVLIVIDPPNHFPCDIVVRTSNPRWVFDGHASERRIDIALEGRRVHNARPAALLLPSISGCAGDAL